MVITIANSKGGTGKTTTAVNLGAALAENEQRILLVDLDPQGNLSVNLGVDIDLLSRTIYDVLLNPESIPISQIIISKLSFKRGSEFTDAFRLTATALSPWSSEKKISAPLPLTLCFLDICNNLLS